ncbi:FAD-dependent oxidoreductase, partial [Klebsiella pneumoniae]|uniref:FAD-dependent oxidoreductase n=1 Tax=Klebsiella pneumoniae TaxID=573 RepID=UPI00272FBDB9
VALPVYPLKGYSITVLAGSAAPSVSVTDAARKVVFARVGERLRVAGMAELTGEDRSIQPARIASLLATARDVFPQGGDYGDAQPWAGL